MKIFLFIILIAQGIILYGQPQKRNSASILYHPELKEVLVYGGSTHSRSSTRMQDSILWTWNGMRWKALTTAPSIRADAILVYNTTTQKLILTGGGFNYTREKRVRYNDTWEFDGKSWKQTSQRSLSNPLFHTAGSFYPETGSLILFGGFDAATEKLSDLTWLYKDAIWTQCHPEKLPPARNLHSMFTDPKTKGVVIAGG